MGYFCILLIIVYTPITTEHILALGANSKVFSLGNVLLL